MCASAAQAYRKVSVDTAVVAGDPHQLILMLFDGAIAAARAALGHLQAGRVADKCEAIGRALRIVDEGLKASLDRDGGGELAARLAKLYDYLALRLLQANLRNDGRALEEAVRLLGELRQAWAQVKPRQPAGGEGPATVEGVRGVAIHA